MHTDHLYSLPLWALFLIAFLPPLLLYIAIRMARHPRAARFLGTHLSRYLGAGSEEGLSVDQISKVLEQSNDKELKEEGGLLKGIIRFGDETAKEVMTPRSDLVGVNVKTGFSQLIRTVIDNVYSRMPVWSGDMDNIVGILYIKDLLPHLSKGPGFRWQSLVRPAYFVPETKMIDDLLREFQTSKVHIAIVVDEFGGTSGIVTMEDIIEEIVGEIRDEYDDEERRFVKLNPYTFLFEGKTLLTDFCKAMNLDDRLFSKVQGEADTLAGLLLELKGGFPKLHEIISCGPYKFEATKMTPRRICKVKFMLPHEKNETSSAGQEPKDTKPQKGAAGGKSLPGLLALACLSGCLMACHPKEKSQDIARETTYRVIPDTLPFSFELPEEATLRPAQAADTGGIFFDILFPRERAKLYCTYRSMQPDAFATSAEESRRLVYFHTTRADAIDEQLYHHPAEAVSGILYRLQGPVATPAQFSLTDSSSFFFHASLYFDSGAYSEEKADTLAELYRHIEHLMESFRKQPSQPN